MLRELAGNPGSRTSLPIGVLNVDLCSFLAQALNHQAIDQAFSSPPLECEPLHLVFNICWIKWIESILVEVIVLPKRRLKELRNRRQSLS